MKREHYVYAHYAEDDDERMFYIGVGTKARAWSTHGRSEEWKQIVREHGRRVVLLSCNMTKPDALKFEAKLIEMFSNASVELVNIQHRRKLLR